MLFVTYWEIDPEKAPSEIVAAGRRLIESDAFPPGDVETVRWDATVDGWGITIFEADAYEDVLRAHMAWQELSPGWFSELRTAPAAPAPEATMEMAELVADLPGDG